MPTTLRLPDGRLVGTLTELRTHMASEPENSGLFATFEAVFGGDDDGWKYWCVSLVGDLDAETQQRFLPALRRIVEPPAPGETKEEVVLEARELLERLRG